MTQTATASSPQPFRNMSAAEEQTYLQHHNLLVHAGLNSGRQDLQLAAHTAIWCRDSSAHHAELSGNMFMSESTKDWHKTQSANLRHIQTNALATIETTLEYLRNNQD